jgi:hypothetical protein
MTEIDYTILEGLATPVEIDDEWIRFRGDHIYISFLKNNIESIEDREVTVRITIKSSVVTIWKEINHVHITIL